MTNRLVLALEDFAKLDGVPGRDTLRRLIKENPDFPAKVGRNGVPYEVDVKLALNWLAERADRERKEQDEREDAARQLALEMLGPASAADLDCGFTVADRKALLEEEFFRIKVAEKRGELIRKAEIEAAIANVLVRDAQRRATFMARLGKRVELPREIIAAGEALMDADRRAFASELEALTDSTGDHAASEANRGDGS